MAKLSDIKITACPSKPGLFPHIHFGEESCARPRYYRSNHGTLEHTRGSQFTINEIGSHNHGGLHTFDALAQLFAAAPRMLALLDALTDDDHMDGSRATMLEAHQLVATLSAFDIPDADETGWGPYFNKDGTPWSK